MSSIIMGQMSSSGGVNPEGALEALEEVELVEAEEIPRGGALVELEEPEAPEEGAVEAEEEAARAGALVELEAPRLLLEAPEEVVGAEEIPRGGALVELEAPPSSTRSSAVLRDVYSA